MDLEPKLFVVMHICTANQWKEIVIEQLNKIKLSGLYDKLEKIYCGVVGKGDISFLKDWDKIELAYVHYDISQFEFLTLEWMQEFSKYNPNCKILYLHTKGISTYGRVHVPPSELRQSCIDDWRRYMEHFLIDNYKACVDELDKCDLVGILWRGFGTECKITPNVPSHFSGNFWWAHSRYLSILGKPREGPNKRCNAEFWVGKEEGIVVSLSESDVNHYKSSWPYSMYSKVGMNPVYFNVLNGISERI